MEKVDARSVGEYYFLFRWIETAVVRPQPER
jgi:hypothetical protein